MKQYLDLMRLVREHGAYKSDRTGTGTYSVFGHQMRFDLSAGFPLVTTKKCHLKSIIHELLWFLQGDTNIKYLKDNDVRIWDEWADENGDLGPVYGYQWRSWPNVSLVNNEIADLSKEIWDEVYHSDDQNTYVIYKESIDQITNLIEMIKKNPDSRRLIVSAWNPALVDQMALPPCHVLFQFYSCELTRTERLSIFWNDDKYKEETLRTYGDPAEYGFDDIEDSTLDEFGVPTRKLSCQLYQRSADIFLGVPFNIASYALLTMMVAKVTGQVPGDFIWTGGDCHLYSNHLEQTDLQLTREPHPLPKMKIADRGQGILDFKFEDFELVDYQCHPHIAAKVAV